MSDQPSPTDEERVASKLPAERLASTLRGQGPPARLRLLEEAQSYSDPAVGALCAEVRRLNRLILNREEMLREATRQQALHTAFSGWDTMPAAVADELRGASRSGGVRPSPGHEVAT